MTAQAADDKCIGGNVEEEDGCDDELDDTCSIGSEGSTYIGCNGGDDDDSWVLPQLCSSLQDDDSGTDSSSNQGSESIGNNGINPNDECKINSLQKTTSSKRIYEPFAKIDKAARKRMATDASNTGVTNSDNDHQPTWKSSICNAFKKDWTVNNFY